MIELVFCIAGLAGAILAAYEHTRAKQYRAAAVAFAGALQGHEKAKAQLAKKLEGIDKAEVAIEDIYGGIKQFSDITQEYIEKNPAAMKAIQAELGIKWQ